MKGLSGWLTPDGKFYSCKFGEHGKVAKQLLDQIKHLRHKKYLKNRYETAPDSYILKEELYIVMGSKGEKNPRYSYIHIFQKITKKQRKWIHDHLDQFDESQLKILKEHGIIR